VPAIPRSYYGGATTTSGAGRTAHDDEASAPCAGRLSITQPSSRITNTPAAGSGADAGHFSHWPHPWGGASLSGISTTATRLLVVEASASDTGVAAAVAVVATADATTVAASAAASTAVPSRCGHVATAVSRGGSPVAAALTATRVALDERRLVNTVTSNLGTFVGARAGTVGVAQQMGNTRVNIDPSRLKTHGGNATHLRLEKPHFLFLEGLGGAPVAPAGAAVALAGASAAPAGASTDNPAAGTSTPAAGASSTAASAACGAACGDGGGGLHLSVGGPPPSLSSSSSFDDEEFAGVARERAPAALAASTPRPAAPGAPAV
jgi:hypothetical protein